MRPKPLDVQMTSATVYDAYILSSIMMPNSL